MGVLGSGTNQIAKLGQVSSDTQGKVSSKEEPAGACSGQAPACVLGWYYSKALFQKNGYMVCRWLLAATLPRTQGDMYNHLPILGGLRGIAGCLCTLSTRM